MADVIIRAGVCGFTTVVSATVAADGLVDLRIESDCESVLQLSQRLARVDPFREFTYRGPGPETLQAARAVLPHPACIVPAGMIKSIEVAAGLALPRNALVEFPSEEELKSEDR